MLSALGKYLAAELSDVHFDGCVFSVHIDVVVLLASCLGEVKNSSGTVGQCTLGNHYSVLNTPLPLVKTLFDQTRGVDYRPWRNGIRQHETGDSSTPVTSAKR